MIRTFVCVFFCFALPCAAQQQHFLIEETAVRSGMGAQFETAQKDYCTAVVRGGAPACLVLSPTTFSPGGRYLTLLSFGSFGHYDEGTYTSKGLTPDQAKELNTRRSPTIASNVESGIALRAEASYMSAEPGSLALITDLEIVPGTLAALLTYLQQVEIPAAHGSGLLSCELYQVVMGGATNRYLLLRRFNTFQQLDKVVPFGDAAALTHKTKLPGAELQIRQSQTTVMRVRMDLSATR